MSLSISRGIKQHAQKIVLYGVEGVGKSTFASEFPKPLFIDTENSTRHLDVARIDPAPQSWTELEGIVADIRRERPCSTLVIDTIDWAEQLCIGQICAENKWKSIESPSYGAGYTMLRERVGRLLDRLTDVSEDGINVLLVAHATMRKFEQPDEAASYDRWELKLQRKVSPIVKEWADAVLFVNYKTVVESVSVGMGQSKGKARGGQKRVMYAQHHACWDAKNRWGLQPECEFDYSVIAPHVPELATAASTSDMPVQAAPVSPATQAPQGPAASQATAAQPDPFWGEQGAPEGFRPGAAVKGGTSLPDYFAPLLQLMERDGATMDEVQDVVAKRGYYTADTPPEKYERGFVEGVLIAAWDQVNRMIKDEVPF